MGHYDDCYEAEEEKSRKHRAAENKKAKEFIRKAMYTAIPTQDNQDIFRQKLEEALFWMEK